MERETLYRGVSRDHPGYDNALQGEAFPRGGPSSALQHQTGRTDSPFTSWSSDPSVAAGFAGNEGVIMQKEFDPAAAYFWKMPSGGYGEQEVLIEGPVTGAGIYHP